MPSFSGMPGILFTAIIFAIGWFIGANLSKRIGLA